MTGERLAKLSIDSIQAGRYFYVDLGRYQAEERGRIYEETRKAIVRIQEWISGSLDELAPEEQKRFWDALDAHGQRVKEELEAAGYLIRQALCGDANAGQEQGREHERDNR